jgi:RNA polymerase sigma-70 factor (ECF subfamily)
MSEAQAISIYQPLLHSIALSILGSQRDAEDLVQDTFLKWLSNRPQKIENTRAYLVQAVRNNAIKYKQAFQQRKVDLLDHFPEHLTQKFHANFDHIDIEQELQRAADVIHSKLEPLEKGVFILREIFELEYDEIQDIFEKRKDHCRQLLSRARKKMDPSSVQENVSEGAGNLLQHLKKAMQQDKLSDLIQHLKEEIG